MHACCAPCSCFPLTFLCPHFNVTIFYNNSNIYPTAEYERRRDELKKFLEEFERDYHYHVDLIIPPYDEESYAQKLRPLAHLKKVPNVAFIVIVYGWKKPMITQSVMALTFSPRL